MLEGQKVVDLVRFHVIIGDIDARNSEMYCHKTAVPFIQLRSVLSSWPDPRAQGTRRLFVLPLQPAASTGRRYSAWRNATMEPRVDSLLFDTRVPTRYTSAGPREGRVNEHTDEAAR